ncbi:MAG: aminopeptidase P family protein [SAR202 cluster bacterium]|nr:aminopeptidase P family protein [SAR202 cluster bacterium]
MSQTIAAAQEYMSEHQLDGWLLRDYFNANPILWAVLGGQAHNVTRPCWLFIPPHGQATVLAHSVDTGRFRELFAGWNEDAPQILEWPSRQRLLAGLKQLLPARGRIAMEYSPEGALPRVGRVDAGSVELVRGLGVEIVSSGDVLQYATERWDDKQLASHRFAAAALGRIVHDTFKFVAENVNWKLTEHDVAQFIRGRYDRLGLEASDGPIASVGPHSSDPHYEPTPERAAVVRKGSWLLIDLWARQKGDPASIYADITWTCYVGRNPTPQHRKVFEAVRDARDAAVEFMAASWKAGNPIEGWQVDRAARDLIEARGFGNAFVHRLGHSLGRSVHSNAVNLDDWETRDTRRLIAGIGVTVEPGIYLPDFGVRSEIDVYLTPEGPEVTTEVQTEIALLDI